MTKTAIERLPQPMRLLSRLLSCIRWDEVILLQGAPVIGVSEEFRLTRRRRRQRLVPVTVHLISERDHDSVAEGIKEIVFSTPVQLSLLIDSVDWRAPEQKWRPAIAG
jgi:hypothetical protein